MVGEAISDLGCGGFVDDVGEEGEAICEVLTGAIGAGHVVVVRCLDEKRGRQHVGLLADRIKNQVTAAVPGEPQ